MSDVATQNQAILVQKKEAWGQMGIAVYQAEQSLSLEAQNALNNITLPTKIEEVPEAEEMLKEIKKACTTITIKRKEITSKFDDVTARLMAPEKSFADPVKQLSDAIIAVKKSYQIEQDKLRNIADEKQRCREFFQNKKIEAESKLENKLFDGVSRCYENALQSNIEPKDIAHYKDMSCNAITDKMFLATPPQFTHQFITGEDVLSIASEVWVIDSSSYVTRFATEIESKFSDYDVAFANKAQALANSKKEEADKQAEIEQAANQQKMAVKIEAAVSQPVVETVDTKALKQGFIVDMPENVESVLMIMAAFSANLNLCMQYLKVTKWFSFTAQQAATALGKCKCDDNAFAPSGIIFKQIDKL